MAYRFARFIIILGSKPGPQIGFASLCRRTTAPRTTTAPGAAAKTAAAKTAAAKTTAARRPTDAGTRPQPHR